MKKGDKILIISILIVSLVGFLLPRLAFPQGGGGIAVIEVDGKVFQKVPLRPEGGPRLIEVRTRDGRFDIIEVKDGRVRVSDANCPERVCIKTGWISRPGETIVCVPNKIVIYIEGKRSGIPGSHPEEAIDGLSY